MSAGDLPDGSDDLNMTAFETGSNFAEAQDRVDVLAAFRNEFLFPQKNGKDSLYFCGHSLGLQPRNVSEALQQELRDWAEYGVEGHFHAKNPWFPYHENVTEKLARVVGAKPLETVAMNSLTVNLHLMMVSFYRPTKSRHKILIEQGAFPSDRMAVESQIRFHGFDPVSSMIELKADTQGIITEESVLETIRKEGQSIALVMLPGVQFYSGQAFDIKKITEAAVSQGCRVGWDLAHAAGNLHLKLHDWNVDFAVWCSYKYLNSGPGAVAGCFVHEKHAHDKTLPRFAGWWGHIKQTRFQMNKNFEALAGAEGWQLSNPPIFSLTPLRVSLDLFDRAGIENLRNKSIKLTSYLEFLLRKECGDKIRIFTPEETAYRGCQISFQVNKPLDGKSVFEKLKSEGVFCDWREPNVIRLAPVPLYNRFQDVYDFVRILKSLCGEDERF